MGKAPAFQFYANDFLQGSSHFTLEQRGAYVTWLCQSWDKGPLPLSEQQRATMIGVSLMKFRALWAVISEKWVETDDGYVNLKLEQVREEQVAYSGSQSARATARWARVRAGKDAVALPRQCRGSARMGAEHMPEGCSSIFDLQSSDQDQNQDQRAKPRRSLAHVVEKPEEHRNYAVVERIAHEVLAEIDDNTTLAHDAIARLKDLCGRRHILYEFDAQKALDSARVQRGIKAAAR